MAPRWVLLLQEFEFEIRDRKGLENQVTDHLSRLENGGQDGSTLIINESFPDEQPFVVNQCKVPWYVDYVNYLESGILLPNLNSHQKKKFLHDVKFYYWDEPFLFKQYGDQILRRCIPKEEIKDIL